MRGLFVTGTDTGAGKTVVAGAICAALRERGEPVVAYKPVVTGLAEPPGDWPTDDELLHAAADEAVVPHRYGPPVSPHLAAELAGQTLDPRALVAAARKAGAGRTLIAEGVGGLLVPLTPWWSVRDLALELGLPLVVAARPGLGTINHTLLTIEAARAAGLHVAGVVLTPWPDVPSTMERSNRETIERLGAVPVATLPATNPEALAAAGAGLPLDDWLKPASGAWGSLRDRVDRLYDQEREERAERRALETRAGMTFSATLVGLALIVNATAEATPSDDGAVLVGTGAVTVLVGLAVLVVALSGVKARKGGSNWQALRPNPPQDPLPLEPMLLTESYVHARRHRVEVVGEANGRMVRLVRVASILIGTGVSGAMVGVGISLL